MTYANFKTMVLSYVNRASAVYTSGSLDYVLIAMNDARRDAQRRYAFNLLRGTAFGQLSLAPCSLLTDFDTTPVSTTLQVVKQIDAVYEYGSATVSGTTRYYRTNRIPFHRQSVFETELAWSATAFGGQASAGDFSIASARSFAYQQGTDVFHSQLTTPTWFLFDVIKWMTDHDGGASEDIFLTYFTDWLKWATLLNLNAFLKDVEQVKVSSSLLIDSWNSVKQFDSQQGASVGAMNLD
jgi:hypothetical protein